MKIIKIEMMMMMMIMMILAMTIITATRIMRVQQNIWEKDVCYIEFGIIDHRVDPLYHSLQE